MALGQRGRQELEEMYVDMGRDSDSDEVGSAELMNNETAAGGKVGGDKSRESAERSVTNRRREAWRVLMRRERDLGRRIRQERGRARGERRLQARRAGRLLADKFGIVDGGESEAAGGDRGNVGAMEAQRIRRRFKPVQRVMRNC